MDESRLLIGAPEAEGVNGSNQLTIQPLSAAPSCRESKRPAARGQSRASPKPGPRKAREMWAV